MPHRREFLSTLGAMGLVAGCARSDAAAHIAALKSLFPFPLGNIASLANLDDPEWAGLVVTHFSRLTPEWQMKPEYMLLANGALRFDAPDAIARFAQDHGLGLFGHVLVWYSQDRLGLFPELAADPKTFGRAYDVYIRDAVTHFKGRVTGWDVVNEPIDDEGVLRPCLFNEVLGPDYIRRAFEGAHAADPNIPLFINDYNLEYFPKKRNSLLRMVEGLLKAGTPIHGIGTQTHIAANLAPGTLKTTINDIASLGLKVHISEVDISLKEASKNPLSYPDLRKRQADLYGELAEACLSLKPEQRFGMTFWGLRDSDSWKNAKGGPIADEPCLFDAKGRLKPVANGLKA